RRVRLRPEHHAPALLASYSRRPKEKGASSGSLGQREPRRARRRLAARSGRHVLVAGVAQDVAAAPHGLDVMLAPGGRLQLLPELADEDVDDLELRLIHAAIEMIEEHLLGERGALAQREQLQHLVFLAGEMHALSVDLYRL